MCFEFHLPHFGKSLCAPLFFLVKVALKVPGLPANTLSRIAGFVIWGGFIHAKMQQERVIVAVAQTPLQE